MSQLIIEDIKRIVKKTIRAMVIPDFLKGKVTETDPLKIETSVNHKPYPEKVLIIPDHVDELKEGDEVVLLKALGGQRFFVLGTMGKGQKKEPEEEPKEGECPCGCGCKNYSKEDPKDDKEDPNDSGDEKDKGEGNDTEEKKHS